MSPSDQRIAIAKACGWAPDEDHRGIKGQWDVVKWFALKPMPGGNAWICDVRVPDYLTDLNAMHEAESIRDLGRDDHHEMELDDICYRDWNAGKHWSDSSIYATAPQRAEAFLRTLDLWINS